MADSDDLTDMIREHIKDIPANHIEGSRWAKFGVYLLLKAELERREAEPAPERRARTG